MEKLVVWLTWIGMLPIVLDKRSGQGWGQKRVQIHCTPKFKLNIPEWGLVTGYRKQPACVRLWDNLTPAGLGGTTCSFCCGWGCRECGESPYEW